MNYEEMVKLAYDEIIDEFEKEASTALSRQADPIGMLQRHAANHPHNIARNGTNVGDVKTMRYHTDIDKRRYDTNKKIFSGMNPSNAREMSAKIGYGKETKGALDAALRITTPKGTSLRDIANRNANPVSMYFKDNISDYVRSKSKTAYEDIVGGIEKEAANALGKNIQARPGAMHSEFMRRGASAGHASDLINDYRGAVSGQRRMENIMGKHNMGSIYPDTVDKVHDSLRRVGSAMRTPASMAQGTALQKTNARRMQHLLPSVKTAYEDIVGGFEKEAESIGQMAARREMAAYRADKAAYNRARASRQPISFSSPPSKSVSFDDLNRQTRDWNQGISRNISPTSGSKMSVSDMIARNNNSVYKQNNGAYPDRLYK